jgi:hypothetical protein
MKNILSLIWIVLFLTVYTYAGEAKGYKIVLASFPTFDEAKKALDSVGEKIMVEERTLQTKHHFEIVARSSGKAFMLAVEPIETQTDADKVLKTFRQLYPDAFVSSYYGPTEGSVFLKPSVKSEVNTTVETNTTNVPVAAKEKVSVPVEVKVVNEPAVETEESKSALFIVIAFFGIGIVGYLGFKLFRKRFRQVDKSRENGLDEHVPEDLVELIEEEAQTEEAVEESERFLSEKPISPVKVFEPETDVFYKLKKNIFFITLLGELKEAADIKDESRCRDLIDEILRYQKNFRQSVIIAVMDRFVETKAFEHLSALIAKEID